MSCGRVRLASQEPDADGAAASHSAELVRGHLLSSREGPLIRPFGAPSPQGEKGPGRSPGRFRGSLAFSILLFSLALNGPAAACAVPEGFARLATPEAEIAYRWEPERLEVGQFFAAEVIACRAPGPEAVREVVLDAQMLAHGHGMNYRPTATQMAPDRFRITGLMLHMAGRWRLTFDLVQGDRRTRLSRDVDLKP
jgi:hypothetical protein